jgi:hypothetical protein
MWIDGAGSDPEDMLQNGSPSYTDAIFCYTKQTKIC